MVTATSDSTTTDRNDWLDRLEQALLGVGTAASWDDLSLLAQQALDAINEPLHTLVDDDTWNNATRTSADQFTRNAQYYVDKRKDDPGMAGDAWKQYLALIAAAELQLASSSVAQQATQGSNVRIRRVTHPEVTKTGPCARCKELEGEHDADSDDLWFTHPRCACTWEPVDQASFAAGGSPTGFFRDEGGKVHPIFESPNGQRKPALDHATWQKGLSDDEKEAVRNWGRDEGFSAMLRNGAQSGGDLSAPDAHGKDLHNFQHALHTAPQVGSTIMRGVSGLSDEVFDKIVKSKNLRTEAPTSFTSHGSYKPDSEWFNTFVKPGTLATSGQGKHGVIFVAGRGKHNAASLGGLTEFGNEHEAVVPKGSSYNVDKVEIRDAPWQQSDRPAWLDHPDLTAAHRELSSTLASASKAFDVTTPEGKQKYLATAGPAYQKFEATRDRLSKQVGDKGSPTPGMEGAKLAIVHVSLARPRPRAETDVRMNAGAPATAGTPSGYFRDQGGKVHPIFTSPGGVRQPSVNAHEWHQKLTVAQGTAVADWTNYSSPMLKAAARGSLEKVGGHELNNDLYRQLHEFNSAIHTAPQAEGRVYRGITALSDDQFAELTRSKMLRTHSPTSFTTDIGTAADFAVGTKRTDNTAVFIARRHNAADITSMANSSIEHEAVVPQGSTYHVDRVSVEPRPLPATGKRADIYISFVRGHGGKLTQLAATYTPHGYFRDVSGKLFPLYSDA